jgi:hypothetical protein
MRPVPPNRRLLAGSLPFGAVDRRQDKAAKLPQIPPHEASRRQCDPFAQLLGARISLSEAE